VIVKNVLMQQAGATRWMNPGTGRGGSAPVDQRTAEQRAAAKLLAAPPPVPDLHELLRTGVERHHKVLDAHEDLFQRCEWTREVMSPAPPQSGSPPGGDTARLRQRLVEWRERGTAMPTYEEPRRQVLCRVQRRVSLLSSRRQQDVAHIEAAPPRPMGDAATSGASLHEPPSGFLSL
jgi:hypothetical protein